jgi:hypothetical protein
METAMMGKIRCAACGHLATAHAPQCCAWEDDRHCDCDEMRTIWRVSPAAFKEAGRRMRETGERRRLTDAEWREIEEFVKAR